MVSEIIDALTSEDDLTKPLLKTMVFAKRIGNNELTDWAKKELNGYSPEETIPYYRFARTSVLAVMKQSGRLTKEVALPLSCFNDDTVKILIKRRFDHSVGQLQDIVNRHSGNGYIGQGFAADVLKALSNEAKTNKYDFEVVKCNQLVATSELKGMTTIIRTKLLDLLLKLEEDFSQVDEKGADRNTKAQIGSTINYFIGDIYQIENKGDNATINTGNGNTFSGASV
ncbi:hypothetical protein HQN86_08555 [Pedobacter panaciterrae]|uniref:AbiTii domain-containing protein n=1 Tax=Pedobacter panaciterrae TaxID=363849 RepID=UPI00155DBB11|nr:hypothetical protein [Pedobacter panaciterrae]NQX53661.1 hypothetical protein [Pedobacter panaciterrae]